MNARTQASGAPTACYLSLERMADTRTRETKEEISSELNPWPCREGGRKIGERETEKEKGNDLRVLSIFP